MATLSQWNPFRQMARMDPFNNFNELFSNLDARSLLRDAETPLDLRMDVTEDDKSYRVRVDVPGVAKDAIDVSVEGRRVTIQAEIKGEHTKENHKRVVSERYLGRSSRSFTLPVEIDDAKAKAHCENGVLELTLPKKANGRTRKLSVD